MDIHIESIRRFCSTSIPTGLVGCLPTQNMSTSRRFFSMFPPKSLLIKDYVRSIL